MATHQRKRSTEALVESEDNAEIQPPAEEDSASFELHPATATKPAKKKRKLNRMKIKLTGQ